jgi:hypothetical protein
LETAGLGAAGAGAGDGAGAGLAGGEGCHDGGDGGAGGGLAGGVGPPPSGGLGGQVDDMELLPSTSAARCHIVVSGISRVPPTHDGQGRHARDAHDKANPIRRGLTGMNASSARRREARRGHEKDWPHPQLRSAFGLLMANPAPWRPSL